MSAMRNTLNVVRYDWRGFRIGGPEASIRGLWPVLILALLLVFGCFFAVGRLFAGNGGSPLEGSSAAPVAHAAIPSGLQGGSPIAGKVPSSIAEPPPKRRVKPARGVEAQRATTTSSQAFAGATTSTEASARTQPESASAGTQPESASAGTQPESASVEAPEPSSASTGSGSSGGKPSSARGGGGAASGGGGSFDSSE
jgi:uncharacterized membrane protein YgcG